MKDHIVLLNSPGINPEQYFFRLVREFRTVDRFAQCPVLIVTTRFPDGLPENLQHLGVTHLHGHTGNPDALKTANVNRAKAVIVLARHEDAARSDVVVRPIRFYPEVIVRAIVAPAPRKF